MCLCHYVRFLSGLCLKQGPFKVHLLSQNTVVENLRINALNTQSALIKALCIFHKSLCFFPSLEQLLEFMHQLPAFANMTMSVRRELCSVMVFEVVEQAGTVILHNKQEV